MPRSRPITEALAALYAVQAINDDWWPEDQAAVRSAIAALQRYQGREKP